MLVKMRCGVGLEARQHARFRTRGEHDVLRLDDLRAAFARDFDFAGTREAAVALDPIDLVLLHQELDAFGVLRDDAVLAIADQREIEARDCRNACRRSSG